MKGENYIFLLDMSKITNGFEFKRIHSAKRARIST